MTTGPALDVREVFVALGKVEALRCVSLDVQPGEVVAVAGPSGSGKSTLLRALLGLTVPRSGSVAIDGRVVSRDGRLLVPPEQRGLAMVFQDLALWPHLTAAGNLEFVLIGRGVPRAERERRVEAVLARIGLANKASVRPGSLSGGERQRVALGRALVQEPRAILLDEPLASLDVLLKAEMLSFLRSMLQDRPCPVVYVTHDGAEASAICDRVVVLEEGRIVQAGSLAVLGNEPATEFVRAFVASARRENV
jgi:ABC-type sugar transport system ATPase subunit